MITKDELMAVLNYDPETGVFTWRVKMSQKMPGSRAGNLQPHGYIKIRINRRHYYAHRLAWLYMSGEWPKEEVDHINGDRSDNRWANLRAASRNENQCNVRLSVANTSGVRGVVWCKSTSRWRAQIKLRRKMFHVGRYDSIEEAAAAYADAARKLHGKFANPIRGNGVKNP